MEPFFDRFAYIWGVPIPAGLVLRSSYNSQVSIDDQYTFFLRLSTPHIPRAYNAERMKYQAKLNKEQLELTSIIRGVLR